MTEEYENKKNTLEELGFEVTSGTDMYNNPRVYVKHSSEGYTSSCFTLDEFLQSLNKDIIYTVIDDIVDAKLDWVTQY